MPAFLRLHRVSFSYESAKRPLFNGLDVHFPPGWAEIGGANGVGKSTLLKLATGLLPPPMANTGIAGIERTQQPHVQCRL